MPTAYDTLVLAESALVNYWPLDEASGSTANDNKGSLNGALGSGVVFGASPIFAADASNLGSFDGSSGAEITFADEGLNLTAFSIELIVFVANNPASVDVGFIKTYDLEQTFGFPSNGYFYSLHTHDGNLAAACSFNFNSSASQFQSSAGNNLAQFTAYHVVLTSTSNSGGTQTLYINGVSVGTRTGNWNRITGIAAIGFAGFTSTPPISGAPVRPDGTIGKVALYNAALSGSAVLDHYNALAAVSATVGASTATASAESKTIILVAAAIAAGVSNANAASSVAVIASAVVIATSLPTATAESKAAAIAAATLLMAADATATAMTWASVGVHPNNMRVTYDWRGSWYLAWRSDQGRIQIFRYLDDGTLDPNSPLPDANGVGDLVADDVSFGFTVHWENVHCLETAFSVDQELRRFRSFDSGYSWAEFPW